MPALPDKLVAEYLRDAARHADRVLADACAKDTDLADDLRAKFELMRNHGMLGPVGRAPGRERESWSAERCDADAEPESAARYESIGPYRPLKELGQGGQGVVLLAEDMRLHRSVALKVLKGLGALSETTMHRFRREAAVASQLDHPGICPVYDAGVQDGVPYIAMRYVPGKTLADRIEQAGAQKLARGRAKQIALADTDGVAMPNARRGKAGSSTKAEIARILLVLEKAARALHAAHEAGIIHRDVKPGNVMITPEGEPVWLDFGLAGAEDDGMTLTATGDIVGTPAYMSPEQLMAQRVRLDRRTDVYSLGVTLYECLTLQRPFKAATREAMFQAIQTKDPIDPRALNPFLPADLRVVLDTALEKDRDRRYQTALDLAEDLRRVRESKPIEAKPVGAIGRAVRWAKRRPGKAALVASLVIGIPLVTALASYVIANEPNIEKQRQAVIAADVERLLERGYEAFSGAGYEDAVRDFEAAERIDANSTEAVAGHGLTLIRLGRMSDALTYLDARRALANRVSSLGRLRADVLAAVGRKEDAKAAVDALPEPTTALDHWLEGIRVAHLHSGGPSRYRRRSVNVDAVSHALPMFRRAVLTAPRARFLYHRSLAEALAQTPPPHEGRHVARAIRRLWPELPSAPLIAAVALTAIAPDEAAAACRSLLAADPSSVATRRVLCHALCDAGKWEEALETIADISGGPEFDVDRANILMELGRYAEGLVFAERAAEAWPHEPSALTNHALLLRNNGRAEEARQVYRRLLEMPLLPRTRARVLINASILEADLDRRLAMVREACTLAPAEWRAHSALGYVLRLTGRLEEAERTYRRAIELDPLDRSAISLALLLTDRKKYDEALPWIERGLPDEPLAHFCLARVRRHQGRYPEAIAAAKEAIRRDPKLKAAHDQLSSLYIKCNQGQALVEHLRAMLKRFPSDERAWPVLAQQLRALGRTREAVRALRGGLRHLPRSGAIYHELGRSFMALRRRKAALGAFEKAVALDPDDPSLQTSLGFALDHQKEHERAARCYEKALALDPRFHRALVRLGLQAERLGRGDEAIVHYGKALEIEPGDDRCRSYLGSMLVKRGRYEEALPHLKRVKDSRVFGDALRIQYTLLVGVCHAALGRHGDALRPIRKAAAWAAARRRRLGDLRNAQRRQLQQTMRYWILAPVFAPIRDEAAIMEFDAEERETLTALWADVKAMVEAPR